MELVNPHTESKNQKECCPYVAQVTDQDLIREQHQVLEKEQNTMKEALEILEDNPGSSLIELKAIASKKNLDFSVLSQNHMKIIMRSYKKQNRQSINSILETQKTLNENVFLRESCHYNINLNGEEKNYSFHIWASPSQISRLRTLAR